MKILVSAEIIQEYEKRRTNVDIDESKAITWNETRKKYGLNPIPGGDVVLISKYDNIQALNQKDCQPHPLE